MREGDWQEEGAYKNSNNVNLEGGGQGGESQEGGKSCHSKIIGQLYVGFDQSIVRNKLE